MRGSVGVSAGFALALLAASSASAQSWPSVSTDMPAAGGGGNDAAVIVGVSRYAFLPEIPGAAENASSWAQYFLRVRKIPSGRVLLLTENEATKERIESALHVAVAATRPGGQTWFIFIGHGAPSGSGDDGLVLGVDTQPDIESLTNRGLQQKKIATVLSSGAGGGVAVFDACFSGKASDGGQPLVRGLQATLPVRAAIRGNVTMLSSSETFAGPLPGVDRPAFSYVLLGALRGWADINGDQSVTVDEAIEWTRDTLQATLKGSGRLPSVRGAKGIILAKNVSEVSPDVDAIVIGRCPDDKRWDGHRCETIACPEGTKWNGKLCAATAAAVGCPSGTAWNGKTCVGSTVSCPTGTTWRGTQCVSEGPSKRVAAAKTLVVDSSPQRATPTPVVEPRVRRAPVAGSVNDVGRGNPALRYGTMAGLIVVAAGSVTGGVVMDASLPSSRDNAFEPIDLASTGLYLVAAAALGVTLFAPLPGAGDEGALIDFGMAAEQP